MHPNVCSFAKAVLEEVMGNDVYEGLGAHHLLRQHAAAL